MRKIIGIGNPLRGEDAFGYDMIAMLMQSHQKPQVDLIYKQQLTPELCLELLDATELVFIDAGYLKGFSYILYCPLEKDFVPSLSHHISVKMLLEMLGSLYGVYPKVIRICLAVNDFEKIASKREYDKALQSVAEYISSLKAF